MAQRVLFGRYRLLEPAGTGGSAEVWRALDTTTGEEVAVKRLHPIVFGDRAGRARLKREFRALRSLSEPHIVRVRALELGDDEAAIILDYVPGQSLAERLAKGPRLDVREALGIARDVAAALAAAHAAGIVHRDVTPGNILLDNAGGARLTDFGIALGSGAELVTATGELMGTMRFLAPEQLRGAAATPATDLHSLAAVTYEMLAGRPAYDATTPVALAEAQDLGAAPIETIPPALDAAVRIGMAPDPADRPPDVVAFAASLSAALLADAVTQRIVGLESIGLHVEPESPEQLESDPAGAGLEPAASELAPVAAEQQRTAPEPEPERASSARPAAAEQPTGSGPRSRRTLVAPLAGVMALAIVIAALAAIGSPLQPLAIAVPSSTAAPSFELAVDPPSLEPSPPPPAQKHKKGEGGKGKGHH